MRIHFQPGDKSVAGVCEPGPAADEMVSNPVYGDKGYPGYRYDHIPGTVGGCRRCRIYGIIMVRLGTVRRTEMSALRQIRAELEQE